MKPSELELELELELEPEPPVASRLTARASRFPASLQTVWYVSLGSGLVKHVAVAWENRYIPSGTE